MSETSLKEQIRLLSKLQTIDTEIYSLNKEKRSKPEEIKALELAFEEKKKALSESEKTLLDLQKQKKEREIELGSKEEAAKKLQTQLYQLKTNKEYQAMMQQIADTKADASVSEDKILELMDGADQAKKDIDRDRQEIQVEEKKFNEDKSKIEERVREIDARLAQLDAQRKQASVEINPEILSQYQRILENRDGLAIVTAKKNSCQGCNMFVPAQVINLIKMYDRIITCEVCNRMFYIEEDFS